MDEEGHTDSDLQKCISEGPMDTDEGPLINENSNGLSHLLTEGEFNSVDAVGVDESSASNQAFLNAVELSTGSVGDYLENDNQSFNAGSFDVGDNAVQFPSDSLNNVLSDGDSRLSDSALKNNTGYADGDVSESQPTKMETEPGSEVSFDMNNLVYSDDISEENLNEAEEIKEPQEKVMEIPDEVSLLQENHHEDSMAADDDSMKVNASEDGDKMKEVDSPSQSASKNDEDSLLQPDLKNDEVSLPQPDLKNYEDSVPQPDIKNDADSFPTPDVKNYEDSVSQLDIKKDEDSAPQPDTKKKDSVPQHDLKIDKDSVPQPDIKKSEDSVPEPNIKHKENSPPQPRSEDDSRKVPEIGGAEETEVVSEDELPAVEKPKIKDAENVSDDELPGPKPAELPADTEVVSEDELPSSKKETKESRKRKTKDEEGNDYDPQSPTSESESATKKQAVAKNGESKPIPAEKRSSTDEKPKKKLPELDKYWKVVNDDPTDFTGWTYLLQYVDQESDVEAAREAYDAFLSHYPYCYGYWRKYADYEKRKGSKKKCLDVLERGLKAIPLSVDLWIHYLNHVKSTRTEELTYIRSQYERAIEACGLEFRSDRLWESYIKWESENGDALHVTNVYDRLLATPTLGYTSHFDNFQEHIMSEPVKSVISNEELIKLRAEVRAAGGPAPQLDLPPGEDEPPDNIASDEEGQSIKERIIAARRKVHKTTGEEVAARWTFEEGIKRPYFHVKPLERCQLKNWKSYLEWEKQHGTFKRALVLHERCLIACALYEEFWMRLIKFLEERAETDPELISVEREALERACTVHHMDKPELHLHWAHFEEAQGNAAKAAEILERVEKACPNLVQIQYRRVNLERRRGDHEKVSQLFESYISSAKNKSVASALAIKYARFVFHVKQDPTAARKVLDEAITKDPLNQRLHMQRLDLALHTPGTPFSELEELVQTYEKQEGSELEVSAEFAWRRRELAEELGDATSARAATLHQRALARHMRKRARKEKHDAPLPPSGDPKKKEGTSTPSANTTTASSSTYYQTPPATAQSYDQQQYPGGYQPGPWGYQQPPGPPYQHHPHAWPQYPNYY